MNRRTALRAALVGVGALAAGCTRGGAAPTPSTPDFAALETQLPGRLGVFAFDTGSGASVGHRSDERFLMCSTAKTLTVAAVLQQSARRPGLLGEVIRYGQADVLE